MPLDRLVLILVCVIATAGVSIWLALLVLATFSIPQVAVFAVPLALLALVLFRLLRAKRADPS